uniref:Uncharacterized protein MANES_04G040600 n=1 Tax=Rhizophora mucronata TaxID=61149 RepID=A0A2P2LGI9_RHIMU
MFNANTIIILTKCRSTMNNSSTTVISNIIVRNNPKCCVRELNEVVEQWLIPAVEILPQNLSFSKLLNYQTHQ